MLQKSATIGWSAKSGNYRIEAVASLNHHCAKAHELESMFPTQVLKILLQQYLPRADIARYKKVDQYPPDRESPDVLSFLGIKIRATARDGS